MNEFVVRLVNQPDAAFREVLVFALIATPAVMVLHAACVLLRRRPVDSGKATNLFQRLVYVVLLAAVAVLGGTAFGAVLRFGALSGWWLLIHMVAAGMFVAALPLFSLSWCHANRFCTSRRDTESQPIIRFPWIAKLMFWLILVGGLLVALTMLVSMLPLFDTEGLHEMLVLHRYSGLLVVVAAAIHLYGLVIRRLGWG